MGLDSVLWTREQLHEGRKVALHCRLRLQRVNYQIASTETKHERAHLTLSLLLQLSLA